MRVILLATVIAGLTGCGAAADAATSRYNQSIAEVQIDTRPCLFFNLAGVPQADPSVSSEKWFTIPTSNPNYALFASILLSGKLSGKPVYVLTDGSTTCGYATVSVVGFD